MLCLTASAKAPAFHSDAKYVQLLLYKIVIQKPWAFEMLKVWSPLQIGRLWPLTWTIGRNDLCWSISVKESRTSVPASLSSSPAVSRCLQSCKTMPHLSHHSACAKQEQQKLQQFCRKEIGGDCTQCSNTHVLTNANTSNEIVETNTYVTWFPAVTLQSCSGEMSVSLLLIIITATQLTKHIWSHSC